MQTTGIYRRSIIIRASPAVVWEYLTKPERMKEWMLDIDTELDINTSWEIGKPIVLKGKLHKSKFMNRGTVLKFEPPKVLQYTHLSSLSRLPDITENYCILEFILQPEDDQTELQLTISNFPDSTIFHHMRFYWTNAIEVLKKLIGETEKNGLMAIDHSDKNPFPKN